MNSATPPPFSPGALLVLGNIASVAGPTNLRPYLRALESTATAGLDSSRQGARIAAARLLGLLPALLPEVRAGGGGSRSQTFDEGEGGGDSVKGGPGSAPALEAWGAGVGRLCVAAADTVFQV